MLCLKEPTLLVDSNELRSYSIQKKHGLNRCVGARGREGPNMNSCIVCLVRN